MACNHIGHATSTLLHGFLRYRAPALHVITSNALEVLSLESSWLHKASKARSRCWKIAADGRLVEVPGDSPHPLGRGGCNGEGVELDGEEGIMIVGLSGAVILARTVEVGAFRFLESHRTLKSDFTSTKGPAILFTFQVSPGFLCLQDFP